MIYRPYTPNITAQALIAAWFFLAGTGGFVFWAAATYIGGSPVTPEIYGPWVYTIPAWAWYFWQLACGWIGALGVIMGSRWVGFIFGIGLGLDMAFLGAAGSLAGPNGFVLSLNAFAWIGPFSLLCSVAWLMGGRHE